MLSLLRESHATSRLITNQNNKPKKFYEDKHVILVCFEIKTTCFVNPNVCMSVKTIQRLFDYKAHRYAEFDTD